ncbi:unnamed protein product [Rotaria sp. Silwood2]|nr:unnamed protein product [Rotaria sp. Silwood2]
MIHIKNIIDDHHGSISTFTILTYNCLASNLAEPKYFPRTDPTHLDFSYRSKLFEHELQSFNADIVCLQEIHQDDFHQWLSPFLFQLGYGEGTFAKRGGTKAKDGVVIFFKRDKFKLINQYRLDYFDIAQVQFPTEASLATYNVALFCLLQIQNNKGPPLAAILDESTTGVDPNARQQMQEIFLNAVKTKLTIILTSHSMNECERVCNRFGIMVNGQLACLGTIQYLISKFGQGYTIEIKVRSSSDDINATTIKKC